jgi:hypothetical protein
MQRNPYKYLDYYTFEDADLFFGREEETQKMVGEILSTRLLVLFSPSGSGKTSLINAGVRPALEELGYKTIYVRLESDPIPSVKNAVTQALGLPVAQSVDDDLHAFLQRAVRDQSSATSIPHGRSQHQASSNKQRATSDQQQATVIFIDQFEEFFIVFENQPELRQQFIEQVAKIKYDDQLPVFLVLSLREDYFANLHEFRQAIPSIFQNNANLRLEPFTEAEARRAIEEPVKAVGCEFEAGLVEQILQDLKNSKPTIEPITLQIVCHTVWEEKAAAAQRLTFADYQSAGGAEHILRNHVSCYLDKLSARQQSLMAKIFAALKTPDDTKRYRTFEDLQATLKLNATRLKRGLDRLVTFNLLRQESRAGTNWYEFKHDYLVPEITKWMTARREAITRRRLWYGIAPGAVLLLSLLIYLLIQYNTFYASFTNREYPQQYREIFIARRFDPFNERTTTGFFLDEARDQNAENLLEDKFDISRWDRHAWKKLAPQLRLDKAGLLLYKIGETQAGIDTLVAALKDVDGDVRAQAAGALGEIKSSDGRVVGALVAALKDQNEYVRRQAAGALGELERVKALPELLAGLKHPLSGYRTAAAQALAQKDLPIDSTLQVIAKLKEDKRPWVRLGVWEAYELLEPRREAEKKSAKFLQEADSVLASGQYSVASGQYESAFESNPKVTRTDSLNAARAKFQQARCAAKLKRVAPALDDLKMAFEYNPTLRDKLQAEMAKPENDWKILAGNRYLREVLLKR